MLQQYIVDFELPNSFSDEQHHALMRVLIKSQLHGHVSHNIDVYTGYPPWFERHLKSIKTFSQAQFTQVIRACNIISNDLKDGGFPILLLKGAAYVAAKKTNANGRLISDVDILVAKEHHPKVESLLLEKGWSPKELDDYDEKYFREWSHELPPYRHAQSGVTLDIHHNLLPGTAGKTIDVDSIFNSKVKTEFYLDVPSDEYLILHSAVHLLLNDDIEKGLRDCLDLHGLLKAYAQRDPMDNIFKVFYSAGCALEFYTLMFLLFNLFGKETDIYTSEYCHSSDTAAQNKEKIKVKAKKAASEYTVAVFPPSEYLSDSSNSWIRLKVYIKGHLSKMPLPIFVKHALYKSYRTIMKKLFGEYFFVKDDTNR